MRISQDQLRVGRVLYEDSELITLEVPKDNQRNLHIADSDRFVFILFVQHTGPHEMALCIPWEAG